MEVEKGETITIPENGVIRGGGKRESKEPKPDESPTEIFGKEHGGPSGDLSATNTDPPNSALPQKHLDGAGDITREVSTEVEEDDLNEELIGTREAPTQAVGAKDEEPVEKEVEVPEIELSEDFPHDSKSTSDAHTQFVETKNEVLAGNEMEQRKELADKDEVAILAVESMDDHTLENEQPAEFPVSIDHKNNVDTLTEEVSETNSEGLLTKEFANNVGNFETEVAGTEQGEQIFSSLNTTPPEVLQVPEAFPEVAIKEQTEGTLECGDFPVNDELKAPEMAHTEQTDENPSSEDSTSGEEVWKPDNVEVKATEVAKIPQEQELSSSVDPITLVKTDNPGFPNREQPGETVESRDYRDNELKARPITQSQPEVEIPTSANTFVDDIRITEDSQNAQSEEPVKVLVGPAYRQPKAAEMAENEGTKEEPSTSDPAGNDEVISPDEPEGNQRSVDVQNSLNFIRSEKLTATDVPENEQGRAQSPLGHRTPREELLDPQAPKISGTEEYEKRLKSKDSTDTKDLEAPEYAPLEGADQSPSFETRQFEETFDSFEDPAEDEEVKTFETALNRKTSEKSSPFDPTANDKLKPSAAALNEGTSRKPLPLDPTTHENTKSSEAAQDKKASQKPLPVHLSAIEEVTFREQTDEVQQSDDFDDKVVNEAEHERGEDTSPSVYPTPQEVPQGSETSTKEQSEETITSRKIFDTKNLKASEFTQDEQIGKISMLMDLAYNEEKKVAEVFQKRQPKEIPKFSMDPRGNDEVTENGQNTGMKEIPSPLDPTEIDAKEDVLATEDGEEVPKSADFANSEEVKVTEDSQNEQDEETYSSVNSTPLLVLEGPEQEQFDESLSSATFSNIDELKAPQVPRKAKVEGIPSSVHPSGSEVIEVAENPGKFYSEAISVNSNDEEIKETEDAKPTATSVHPTPNVELIATEIAEKEHEESIIIWNPPDNSEIKVPGTAQNDLPEETYSPVDPTNPEYTKVLKYSEENYLKETAVSFKYAAGFTKGFEANQLRETPPTFENPVDTEELKATEHSLPEGIEDINAQELVREDAEEIQKTVYNVGNIEQNAGTVADEKQAEETSSLDPFQLNKTNFPEVPGNERAHINKVQYPHAPQKDEPEEILWPSDSTDGKGMRDGEASNRQVIPRSPLNADDNKQIQSKEVAPKEPSEGSPVEGQTDASQQSVELLGCNDAALPPKSTTGQDEFLGFVHKPAASEEESRILVDIAEKDATKSGGLGDAPAKAILISKQEDSKDIPDARSTTEGNADGANVEEPLTTADEHRRELEVRAPSMEAARPRSIFGVVLKHVDKPKSIEKLKGPDEAPVAAGLESVPSSLVKEKIRILSEETKANGDGRNGTIDHITEAEPIKSTNDVRNEAPASAGLEKFPSSLVKEKIRILSEEAKAIGDGRNGAAHHVTEVEPTNSIRDLRDEAPASAAAERIPSSLVKEKIKVLSEETKTNGDGRNDGATHHIAEAGRLKSIKDVSDEAPAPAAPERIPSSLVKGKIKILSEETKYNGNGRNDGATSHITELEPMKGTKEVRYEAPASAAAEKIPSSLVKEKIRILSEDTKTNWDGRNGATDHITETEPIKSAKDVRDEAPASAGLGKIPSSLVKQKIRILSEETKASGDGKNGATYHITEPDSIKSTKDETDGVPSSLAAEKIPSSLVKEKIKILSEETKRNEDGRYGAMDHILEAEPIETTKDGGGDVPDTLSAQLTERSGENFQDIAQTLPEDLPLNEGEQHPWKDRLPTEVLVDEEKRVKEVAQKESPPAEDMGGIAAAPAKEQGLRGTPDWRAFEIVSMPTESSPAEKHRDWRAFEMPTELELSPFENEFDPWEDRDTDTITQVGKLKEESNPPTDTTIQVGKLEEVSNPPPELLQKLSEPMSEETSPAKEHVDEIPPQQPTAEAEQGLNVRPNVSVLLGATGSDAEETPTSTPRSIDDSAITTPRRTPLMKRIEQLELKDPTSPNLSKEQSRPLIPMAKETIDSTTSAVAEETNGSTSSSPLEVAEKSNESTLSIHSVVTKVKNKEPSDVQEREWSKPSSRGEEALVVTVNPETGGEDLQWSETEARGENAPLVVMEPETRGEISKVAEKIVKPTKFERIISTRRYLGRRDTGLDDSAKDKKKKSKGSGKFSELFLGCFTPHSNLKEKPVSSLA